MFSRESQHDWPTNLHQDPLYHNMCHMTVWEIVAQKQLWFAVHLHLVNCSGQIQSCYWLIGNPVRSAQWCYLQWPSVMYKWLLKVTTTSLIFPKRSFTETCWKPLNKLLSSHSSIGKLEILVCRPSLLCDTILVWPLPSCGCLSVCHTHDCVEMAEPIIMQSIPDGSPAILPCVP